MHPISPRSVAVIGASASKQKIGHLILRNLVTQGFSGEVYPINPKGGEILGKPVYASLADVPGPVDLAVVVTPAPTVPGVLRACMAKGVQTAVVISAGFSETHTEEGQRLENAIRDIAGSTCTTQSAALDVIGPNCLGVLVPRLGLNASFAKDLPKAGSVALISQSGAMAVALMDQSTDLGLGFSQVLSIGNKTLLDECDYLAMCENDPATRVIGLYLENIARGRAFLEVAARVAKTKPIVLLKSGVSQAGRQAAASHTGALAGSSAAIDAACVQAGVRRARSAEEFLMLLRTLASQPTLRTNRIAVITNAGGPGILASDAAEAHGLELPRLQSVISNTLQAKLPASASVNNPIDVIGDALADRYVAALDAAGDDPGIDGVVVLLTPQVMTPVKDVALAIARFRKRFPLMPVTACFMGGPGVAEGRAILNRSDIPHFPTPEDAVRAMSALLPLAAQPTAHSAELTSDLRATRAADLLNGTSGLVPEDVTGQLFALYDLPMPQQKLARSAKEAAAIAEDIGFPVVLKISSPQILHKTDVGGIKANLRNADDVCRAYEEILDNVRSLEHPPLTAQSTPLEIRGVLVQKHLPPGNEFIVGGLHDPSFGPMVMAGLGGIYTELFRDTAFRIAPMDEMSAYRMLTELRSWKLLLGIRGKSRSDIDALARLIASVSAMLAECPQIGELDLNPVFVDSQGVTIADAKVVIRA